MKKTIIYVVISTLMFSSMEIALKVAGATFNPIQLNLIRFFIGALVLFPIASKTLKKQQRKIEKKDWMLFLITGFLCVIVSMSLFQLAVVATKASTVAVLFSCNPVFALIFAFVILHERLGRANLIAVTISIIGLIVIVDPFHLSRPFGIILALLSAVTFGFYSIISRYGSTQRGLSGIVMTCYTFIAGTLELLVLAWITHIPAVASYLSRIPALASFSKIPVLQNITLASVPMLLYLGICVTGGGFAFYFLAMENSDVSTASLVFFIKPGLAPIMAAVLIGEHITLLTIIGIIIILIGSVVTFVGNRVKEDNTVVPKDN
ncbi:DMT family transporter [Liquorilactobacillus satsumensis]|uniref:Transport protein n=1 Tax=Liquorilactobacillus satsumensis DSM 16230 = JCM 12392 TaxID=1423801 RepID=A0A0R1VB40_9LACO|nr:DMT family transporter [Liquorilactobacillus satsumensis]KRM00262.1 transport protein [Liquorilactobacillus satsumensis DSM 16230 = JCM 12392]MCC7665823.1 EamA family transporter [Liquorilactobacillus satsumensis]MCP9313332.1 EamA family transporter [Liquorilactobacillus satsumensis]MCP9328163.1 EamA family transporter [Liquorilactobacillus satsumensis]MCP9356382.1 EamA family transporter [Liquorilactobacillus satsumensis]